MDVSCAFPTTLESPAHIQTAEELGYARAWLYDTPQNSPDVWMTLALAAARTTRIGLGPAVLVPTLRHPMVNAAATAMLVHLAPGRVTVAFGTGFSGRRAMGYGAIPWSFVRDYVAAYRGLLRGDVVEWEGAWMQMLHPTGSAPPRPISVPLLLAAGGPKGLAAAADLADGIFVVGAVPEPASTFPVVCFLASGTVLGHGEEVTSPRVRAAAGPGTAQKFHGAYVSGGRPAVAGLPGGEAWLEVVDRAPPIQRHLAVHRGHAVEMNEADQAAWEAGGATMTGEATFTGTADRVRQRLDALAQAGVTEFVYQPAGPDIEAELEHFLAAAQA